MSSSFSTKTSTSELDHQVETAVGIESGIPLEEEGFLLPRSGRDNHPLDMYTHLATVSETCAGMYGIDKSTKFE